MKGTGLLLATGAIVMAAQISRHGTALVFHGDKDGNTHDLVYGYAEIPVAAGLSLLALYGANKVGINGNLVAGMMLLTTLVTPIFYDLQRRPTYALYLLQDLYNTYKTSGFKPAWSIP